MTEPKSRKNRLLISKAHEQLKTNEHQATDTEGPNQTTAGGPQEPDAEDTEQPPTDGPQELNAEDTEQPPTDEPQELDTEDTEQPPTDEQQELPDTEPPGGPDMEPTDGLHEHYTKLPSEEKEEEELVVEEQVESTLAPLHGKTLHRQEVTTTAEGVSGVQEHMAVAHTSGRQVLIKFRFPGLWLPVPV